MPAAKSKPSRRRAVIREEQRADLKAREQTTEAYDSATPTQLLDPLWRIRNIYVIRNEQGKPEPFVPNAEQEEVLQAIYIDGNLCIIIPKARQIGFSTLMALICLDCILFGSSIQCSLVDLTAGNAKKKLTDKILFAFDRLPPALRACYVERTRNVQQGEFAVSCIHSEDPNAVATMFADDKQRGGTNQLLWISEWAEVSVTHPAKSQEILLGAWPTGEQGLRIIETTWHGGKRGHVWPIVRRGLETPANRRTPTTPRVMFFPWFRKASYARPGDAEEIKEGTARYFAEKQAKLGRTFTVPQQLWYQDQAETLGIFVKGQYPTDIDECFEAPVKGAIWAQAIANARAEGRITPLPVNYTLEVDTFWDLGAPDNTATLYVQHQAGERHMIDFDFAESFTLAERVRHMKRKQDKGYHYGTHYLPHDGAHRQKNGISFQAEFAAELVKQGVGGRVVGLKSTTDKWLSINHSTGMIKHARIDAEKCKKWVEAAELYRRKGDPNDDERFLDEVYNDWTNHCCLDGDTEVETNKGKVSLRHIKVGMKAKLGDYDGQITAGGPTYVQDCYRIDFDDGTYIISSGKHKFFTNKGLARCDTLRHGEEVWTPKHHLLNSLDANGMGLRTAFDINSQQPTTQKKGIAKASNLKGDGMVEMTKQVITVQRKKGYIGPSGSLLMARLQKAWMCITRITIKKTTLSKTLNSLSAQIIPSIMPKAVNGSHQEALHPYCEPIHTRPQSGTLALKDWLGIARMVKRLGMGANALKSCVLSAIPYLPHHTQHGERHVQLNANVAIKGIKKVTGITALPPRLLYDITVDHHHAYVANGVLVSNCDSFRTMAEAALAGHLPSTSNGIMTNTYFDSIQLSEAIKALTANVPTIWELDYQGETFRQLTARRSESGWLRIWNTPEVGQSYLVSLVNGALGVWRQAGWDHFKGDLPLKLVAASIDNSGVHATRITDWAAALSAHYGNAPIAVDVESMPGVVDRLKTLGAGVVSRRQSADRRRVGQDTILKHPGFEINPEVRIECYTIMQQVWRDGQVEIFDPMILKQMGGIITGEGDTPDLMPGFSENWVKMAALGIWQIGQAAHCVIRSSGPSDRNRASADSGRVVKRRGKLC